MNPAKIHLSSSELQLVKNAGVLLTKNLIIGKVYELFGELAELLRNEIYTPANVKEDVLVMAPKISRGENYKGLPYVMLDYPRFFGRENVLAARTFFWWGNYFSVTLHLKGEYQQEFFQQINDEAAWLKERGFVMFAGDDEWEHHCGGSDAGELTEQALESRRQGPFLKLVARVELDAWNDAIRVLTGLHEAIAKIIAD